MSKPMVREHNTETNEIIDREMTDAEFAVYQETQAQQEAAKLEFENKLAAKAAVLAQLGITEEQAKLLLS